MERQLDQFNSMHFDTLREIGNIGASHAVTALGKMLDKKIQMSVPSVKLVEFADIADFVGGGDTLLIGILINISGDINGMVMFIVKQDVARKLVSLLMGQTEPAVDGGFTEIELSALQEIGNILGSSYLASLSGLIDKKVTPSVPSLAVDMANAILSVPAIEFGKIADRALLIESVFSGGDDNISGYFLLVPDMPSFNIILSSLGVA